MESPSPSKLKPKNRMGGWRRKNRQKLGKLNLQMWRNRVKLAGLEKGQRK
jgi:hypothetical protein